MAREHSMKSAAQEIIRLRAEENMSDEEIAREHPELEAGFGLARVSARVKKPRGSGPARDPVLPE